MSDLTKEELAGGWLRLCGAMVGFAAEALCYRDGPVIGSKTGLLYRQERAACRRTAARWVQGEPATVPFSEVCEVLDLDEDYARRQVDLYLQVKKTGR